VDAIDTNPSGVTDELRNELATLLDEKLLLTATLYGAIAYVNSKQLIAIGGEMSTDTVGRGEGRDIDPIAANLEGRVARIEKWERDGMP
jgi:hypothetical protein